MKKVHDIKCGAEYIRDIQKGKKTFEVRIDDRKYGVGDYLHLYEDKPSIKQIEGYPNATISNQIDCMCRVTYILKGGQFGIDKDYIVMSIEVL